MSTNYEHYKSGQLYGVKYTFDRVGDCIATHAHDEITAHNVIVMRGIVEISGDGIHEVLIPGMVFDFDWTQPHKITALQPNTIILNLMLNGMPETYKQLPASELKGSYDATPNVGPKD